MIQFKNISKHYQLKGQTIPALDQINLDIPEGSIFGIIGYSGAGKSTLIRLINLLERPTKGQVIINQKDFTALDAKALRQERANIGMIFQHFNLLQTKTVAANIEMPIPIGSIAAIAALHLNLPADTSNFFFQAAIIVMVVGIFNLHPLMELDGYYMLMDSLEVPNLRRRSLQFVTKKLWPKMKARARLTKEEWGFTFFGVLAGLYTILATIGGLAVCRDRVAGLLANLLGETNGKIVTALLFTFILAAAFWPKLKAIRSKPALIQLRK